MLGRRLAGRWVGVLAAAVSGAQRCPGLVQPLHDLRGHRPIPHLRGAVLLRGEPTTDEERYSGGRWSAVGRRSGFAALIAGIAFGQVALARIDFALSSARCRLSVLYLAHAPLDAHPYTFGRRPGRDAAPRRAAHRVHRAGLLLRHALRPSSRLRAYFADLASLPDADAQDALSLNPEQ